MRHRWWAVIIGGIFLFLAGYALGVGTQPDEAKHSAEQERWEQEKEDISKDVKFLRSYIAMLRAELDKSDGPPQRGANQLWNRQPYRMGIGLRPGIGYWWRTDDPIEEAVPCKSPSARSTKTTKESPSSPP